MFSVQLKHVIADSWFANNTVHMGVGEANLAFTVPFSAAKRVERDH